MRQEVGVFQCIAPTGVKSISRTRTRIFACVVSKLTLNGY